MEPTDEDLIRAFREGGEGGFDLLHARYAERLGRFFARMFPSLDPEDLVQEVFLRLVRSRDSFRPDGSLRGWLYAIARNVGIEGARRARGREATWAEARAPVPDASQGAAEREFARAIQAAIEALPELDREILVMAKYEGLSYAEIAEAIGASREAVKVRAFRALVRLREELEGFL